MTDKEQPGERNGHHRVELLDLVRIPEGRQRVPDQVAQALRAWIVREGVPGEFLPTEPVLVEQFGVSRPTIREAMRVLEAEGLIEMKRGAHGGAVVRKPEVHGLAGAVGMFLQRIGGTVAEVFDVRLLLEPEAARRAALRPDRDKVIEVLDACIETEAAAVCGHEPFGVSRRIVEFHNVVLALSGDRVLATFGELLETVVLLQNTRSLSGAEDPGRWAGDAHQAHRRIATAIKRGDAEGAARLVRKHLEVSAQMILANQAHLLVDVVGEPLSRRTFDQEAARPKRPQPAATREQGRLPRGGRA